MSDVELKLNDDSSRGKFVIEDNNEQVAEMAFGVSGRDMTVYHTEVVERLQGQGVAPKLFEAMLQYVREHRLNVIPRCSYVLAQFQRKPDLYADIWKK